MQLCANSVPVPHCMQHLPHLGRGLWQLWRLAGASLAHKHELFLSCMPGRRGRRERREERIGPGCLPWWVLPHSQCMPLPLPSSTFCYFTLLGHFSYFLFPACSSLPYLLPLPSANFPLPLAFPLPHPFLPYQLYLLPCMHTTHMPAAACICLFGASQICLFILFVPDAIPPATSPPCLPSLPSDMCFLCVMYVWWWIRWDRMDGWMGWRGTDGTG